jgi:hypothetical protein
MHGEIPPPHTNLFTAFFFFFAFSHIDFSFITLILVPRLHVNVLFRFFLLKGVFAYFVLTMHVALLAHFILLHLIKGKGQTDMSYCAASVTHGFRLEAVYGVLVGKPEGKRALGRSRRRWEDNIKIDL